MQTCLQLVFCQFEGLNAVALRVSTLERGTSLTTSGLVAGVLIVSAAAFLVVTAVVATATLTAALGVGHDRALLLHVDLLAIASVIASIVATSLLVAAIAATTASTATAASITTIIVIAGLLASRIGSLLLLDHLSLNLILSLHVRVLLLELLPAQLLILDHVLDELLNALANSTHTLITSLRVLPDGLELGEDLIVVLLANLALRRVLSDALLDRRAHLLDEPDGRLDCVILKAARVQQMLEDRFGSVRS